MRRTHQLTRGALREGVGAPTQDSRSDTMGRLGVVCGGLLGGGVDTMGRVEGVLIM